MMRTDDRPTRRRRLAPSRVTTALVLLLSAASSVAVDFDPAEPAPGNMRFAWIHGSISARHNSDVRVQVHRYNEHTYILRQNPAVHWEAPFMYLLVGDQRALLIDSGATEEAEYFPLRATVDAILARWATANRSAPVELTVITTGDAPAQTAGLGQFRDRPGTTVVDPSAQAGAGIATEADGARTIDLGGRVVTVLPTPGVSTTGVVVYDPYTDFLFSGTTFLPGRVVIRDYDAYLASISSLLDFVESHPVKWLMGGQIDMSTTPGVDYRLRSNYRPAEHELQMEPTALAECYDVVHLINGEKRVEYLTDFIVMNGVGRGERPYGYPVYTPQLISARRLR
jgi:glyoxylase-like metal-dependent hydrolase (beta-lactamase superfamily II)